MKKLVLAAVAASMVAAPAMAAPQYGQYGQQGHHAPQAQNYGHNQWQQAPRYRHWRKGERFDARYARNYRRVDYRQFRGRLKAPPRGYYYAQSGNDVVLVSLLGGLIGGVFANLVR